MKKENLYKKAVMKWGDRAQIDMMIEEMAELTKAFCKWRRSPEDKQLSNIYEELVDVEIMLEQMKYVFTDDVQFLKKEKLSRLSKLLE